MQAAMKWAVALCLAGAAVTAALYMSGREVFLTPAITLGTAGYHLGMRLLVGFIFDRAMKNRADLNRKWYRLRPWEARVYKLLRVKKWKGKMPTYVPDYFSRERHSWSEIAGAMCQAELVHETIVVLSFLPIGAAAVFGSFYVFLITSLCAAAFDLCFVIIQRFNRARVMGAVMRERRQGDVHKKA